MRTVIQQFKQTNHTPGFLIDIWGPKGRYVKATGVADLATGERLDKRTQFKLASQTKGFTATLILQLVGEGKVSLTPPPMFQALAMKVFGGRLGFGLSTAEALEPNCFGVGTPPDCAP